MIDRGADDRQAKRHVDAVAKARVFQRSQPLVVIHRQHAVALFEHRRREHRVGRQRSDQPHTFAAQTFEDRRNDFDFFHSEVATLTRVRI